MKIPNLLKKKAGGALDVTVVQGFDLPDPLSDFKLAIHCGACMWNRAAMQTRIRNFEEAGLPITNYGLAIAACLGILDRALRPFPEAHAAWKTARINGGAS